MGGGKGGWGWSAGGQSFYWLDLNFLFYFCLGHSVLLIDRSYLIFNTQSSHEGFIILLYQGECGTMKRPSLFQRSELKLLMGFVVLKFKSLSA